MCRFRIVTVVYVPGVVDLGLSMGGHWCDMSSNHGFHGARLFVWTQSFP